MQVPFLSSHGLSSKTGAGRLQAESREVSPGGMSIHGVLVDVARSERDIELGPEHPTDGISMRRNLYM